jgi:hypothetical protein
VTINAHGDNLFLSHVIDAAGISGRTFFLEELNDDSNWRYRSNIEVKLFDPAAPPPPPPPPPPPSPPPSPPPQIDPLPAPSGGGGCTVGPSDGTIDPTLPILLLISLGYLLRRRFSET